MRWIGLAVVLAFDRRRVGLTRPDWL